VKYENNAMRDQKSASAPGSSAHDVPGPGASSEPERLPQKGRIERKDGRRLRRFTLYLPCDVANRLAVECAAHDVALSDFVTAAVVDALGDPSK